MDLPFSDRCDPRLPPLAWCLTLRPGERAALLRGRGVEISARGYCEGVWDGDYAAGRADEADSCMGSAGRLEGDAWVVSTPSHVLEGLYSIRRDDVLHVSNSYVFLLVRAGLSLDPDYRRYLLDLRSGCFGLARGVNVFPAAGGETFRRHLACNLRIGPDLEIRRAGKPRPPHFRDFAQYRAYLVDALRSLAANGAHPARRQPFRMLASVSRGYDSPACAALAAEAGCKEAMTIRDSSWGSVASDDGTAIAERLGLAVHAASLEAYAQRPGLTEAEFVAMGDAGDVQFAAFEDLLPGRMLVTGMCGDDVWSPEARRVSADLARTNAGGSSLGEFRLRVGFAHVPVPTIGGRRHPDIHAITCSTEMDPWRLDSHYDRPIPRRITEEKGVPRDWFGRGKSATAIWWTLRKPKPESAESYAQFRQARRLSRSRRAEEALHGAAYRLSRAWFRGSQLLSRALRRAGVHVELPQVIPRRYTEPANEDMLVQWGAAAIADRYVVEPAQDGAAPVRRGAVRESRA